MEEKHIDSPSSQHRAIATACLRFARIVNVADGSMSKDVLDQRINTLQQAAVDALSEHIMRVGVADETLVANAIDFLAMIHDGPWRGTAWFRHGLDALLSTAAPTGIPSDGSYGFLKRAQQGIMAALSEHMRHQVDTPLTEQEATIVKELEDAARTYSSVGQLLDVIERLHYNGIQDNDTRMIRIAALAAPLSRLTRLD